MLLHYGQTCHQNNGRWHHNDVPHSNTCTIKVFLEKEPCHVGTLAHNTCLSTCRRKPILELACSITCRHVVLWHRGIYHLPMRVAHFSSEILHVVYCSGSGKVLRSSVNRSESLCFSSLPAVLEFHTEGLPTWQGVVDLRSLPSHLRCTAINCQLPAHGMINHPHERPPVVIDQYFPAKCPGVTAVNVPFHERPPSLRDHICMHLTTLKHIRHWIYFHEFPVVSSHFRHPQNVLFFFPSALTC